MLSSKAQNQSALMLTLMNQGNRKLMIRKHASYSQLWIPEQTSQFQIRIQSYVSTSRMEESCELSLRELAHQRLYILGLDLRYRCRNDDYQQGEKTAACNKYIKCKSKISTNTVVHMCLLS